jgi:hypothetical protein
MRCCMDRTASYMFDSVNTYFLYGSRHEHIISNSPRAQTKNIEESSD